MTPADRAAAAAWPGPESLDALGAAPGHHTLVFENAHVRVLETRIPPGDLVPVHTHRWPSVLHVSTWSDFIRRDATGAVLVDSRAGGGGGPAPTVLPCRRTRWRVSDPPRSG